MKNNTYELEKLSDAKHEVLKILWDSNGLVKGYSRIADERDTARSSAKQLVEGMSEPDEKNDLGALVDIEDTKNSKIITLTDTGRKVAEKAPYTSEKPNRSPNRPVSEELEKSGLKRLHAFMGKFRIMSDVPNRWLNVIQEKDNLDFRKKNDDDTIVVRDSWVVRFHKDSLTVQLKEGCSISGSCSSELFRKAHSDAQSVAGWAADVAGVSVQLSHFNVSRNELGFEGHPLAELAGELDDVPLDRFRVVDPELESEALWIDGSPAVRDELEAGGADCESVADTVEKEMRQYVLRPEAVEKRHSFENELLVQGVSGQEAVHGLRKVSSVSESVQNNTTKLKQVQEEVSEVKQVLKDNKDTREAVHEQVRAVNELAQRNQELIESEVVQEESSRDVVEETIEDLLDDDRFSSPGLQYGHLMAWNVEEQECRKILDKSVVRKSDSNLLELVDQWKP